MLCPYKMEVLKDKVVFNNIQSDIKENRTQNGNRRGIDSPISCLRNIYVNKTQNNYGLRVQ